MKKNELAIIGAGHATIVPFAEASASSHPYHHRAKKNIPEALIAKALENNLFPGLQIFDLRAEDMNAEMLSIVGKEFLQREFNALEQLGISLENPTAAENDDLVARTSQLYESKNMQGQAFSLEAEYKSMRSVHEIFNFTQKALENAKFNRTHISLLQSVHNVCTSLKIGERMFVLGSLAEICQWNMLRGKYHSPMALPMEFLPELFVSAPVWFIQGKDVMDRNREDDPKPGAEIKFFCDAVGTKEFTWLFQMYNRRTRTFDKFTGPDIMPPHVAENITELNKLFDYLVIATPYHDIAAKEWADPLWQRSLDPYLLGFKKGLPFMVMIERWSGTGLFPLIPNMIADTINHIQSKSNVLYNFSIHTYWYRGNLAHGSDTCLGSPLNEFGQKIISDFNAGNLFNVLRGTVK